MRKIRSADHPADGEPIHLTELSENRERFRRRQAVRLIRAQGLSSAQIGGIVGVRYFFQ